MSIKSMKLAAEKALQTPKSTPQISQAEAKAIIAAAKEDPKGHPQISKDEADLFKKLWDASAFEPGQKSYSVTSAARRELDAFFKEFGLPFGANEAALRTVAESKLAGIDWSQPLARAPATGSMQSFVIKDDRPVDGALKEAWLVPGKGEFYVKSTQISRMNPKGTVSWYGPISLVAPPSNGGPDLKAIGDKLTAASKGLLYTSESDYPWDLFTAPGQGGKKPTAEEFRQIAKLPQGTKVETWTEADFFKRAEYADPNDPVMVEQSKRYVELQKVIDQNLTDVQVFRTGDIQIGVYVVGRTKQGDLVGLHTTSIET